MKNIELLQLTNNGKDIFPITIGEAVVVNGETLSNRIKGVSVDPMSKNTLIDNISIVDLNNSTEVLNRIIPLITENATDSELPSAKAVWDLVYTLQLIINQMLQLLLQLLDSVSLINEVATTEDIAALEAYNGTTFEGSTEYNLMETTNKLNELLS